MKRFIKEYASYTKKEISNNDMHNALIKDIAIMRIDKILTCHNAGLITVKECMECITNALDYAIGIYNK